MADRLSTEAGVEVGAAGTARVGLAPADQLRVQVTLDPLYTAHAAIQGTLVRTGLGPDPLLRAETARHVARRQEQDPLALAVLAAPVVPTTLQSLLPLTDHTPDEHRDFLCSREAVDALHTDLVVLQVPRSAPAWRGPTDRPSTWMREHAALVVGLTEALLPSWERAAPLLEREVQRVGTAVVRGTTDALLSALHPKLGWSGGELTLRNRDPREVHDRGRTVVLVPRVDGTGLISLAVEESVVYLSYPVPGLTGTGAPAPGSDHLAQLLTPPRARLVRALGVPRTMGELAHVLQLAPSSVTHHCARLERSGIVLRVRRGRTVLVTRTPYGDELVDRAS